MEKIGRNKIPVLGEFLTPVISSGDQLSRDDVVRRNCLVLLAKGFNLTKLIEPTTASLHAHFGTKNIVSVFYSRSTNKIHHDIANVEYLNSAVFKQYLRKSTKLQNKWVTFHPQSNSLDRNARPDDVTLKKLRFTDVNNALADTSEALKNASGPSQPPLNKTDIATLVQDVVLKENNKLMAEFQADMSTLRKFKDGGWHAPVPDTSLGNTVSPPHPLTLSEHEGLEEPRYYKRVQSSVVMWAGY